MVVVVVVAVVVAVVLVVVVVVVDDCKITFIFQSGIPSYDYLCMSPAGDPILLVNYKHTYINKGSLEHDV